jgi:hypothetical protein
MKVFNYIMFVAGMLLFVGGYFFYKAEPIVQLKQMVIGIGIMVTTIGYKYVLGIGEKKS